jgi:hypothetical protein
MTRTTINDSLFGTDPSGVANILDNGGFEIWQRGTTFTNPINTAYTADRWYLAYSGSFTGVVSQNSSTVDTGLYSLELNTTNVSSLTSGISIGQDLESWPAGKPITVSVRINSNVSGVNVDIQQNGIGSSASSNYVANTGWQTLTATYTPTGNSNTVRVYVNCPNAIQTTYMDSAILTVGLQPASAFIGIHPQVDLARCQRYYWQQNSNNTGPVAMLQCTSTTSAYGLIFYPVEMRTRATTTLTGQTISELFTATQGGATTLTITIGTNIRSAEITVTVGSGIVAGNATALVPTNNGFIIEYSSDL